MPIQLYHFGEEFVKELMCKLLQGQNIRTEQEIGWKRSNQDWRPFTVDHLREEFALEKEPEINQKCIELGLETNGMHKIDLVVYKRLHGKLRVFPFEIKLGDSLPIREILANARKKPARDGGGAIISFLQGRVSRFSEVEYFNPFYEEYQFDEELAFYEKLEFYEQLEIKNISFAEGWGLITHEDMIQAHVNSRVITEPNKLKYLLSIQKIAEAVGKAQVDGIIDKLTGEDVKKNLLRKLGLAEQ